MILDQDAKPVIFRSARFGRDETINKKDVVQQYPGQWSQYASEKMNSQIYCVFD